MNIYRKIRQLFSRQDSPPRTLSPLECYPNFPKARAVIVEAFKDRDPGEIRYVYLSNIAMLLHDRFDVPTLVAKVQADAILDLCFGKE